MNLDIWGLILDIIGVFILTITTIWDKSMAWQKGRPQILG